MKNIYSFLVAVAVVALATSCEDFLDKAPIDTANQNGYYQTEAQLASALPACYNSLYDTYGAEGLMYYFGEIWSDEAYTDNTAGQVGHTEAFDTHTGMVSVNTVVEEYWEIYYKAIFRMNTIIQNAGDKYPAMVAEARFLRGLYYFDMARMWGDIPLVTTQVSASESYGIARTPQAEVFKQVVEDLEFAAANLPDKKHERVAGAATCDAANALLGKVYLTMGDKAKAKAALDKVYGKFSLVPEYADLWSLSNKNSSESIFELQYKGGIGNKCSMYWALFSPIDNRVVTAWGAGFNQGTADLWNAYNMSDGTVDPRRDKSMRPGYTTPQGTFVSVVYPIKWMDEAAEVNGLREQSDNNFMVIRYADVLLMLSEATGDAKYMNEVQKRAGVPTTSYSVENLLHERQVELAYEYHRMFDLMRLGVAVNTLKNCSKLKGATITEQGLLLPIPQKVIDQNPDVITQNEAYK